jgi:ADP-ribosylglycohydrolase
MAEIAVILVLGIVALAAVAFPFIAGYARYDDQDALDADIQRYRDALRDYIHDNPRKWFESGPQSAGNGALMRIAPVLFRPRYPPFVSSSVFSFCL